MKSIKILIISFCIILMLSNTVFALGDIFSTGENWMEIGENKSAGKMDFETNVKNLSDNLYNLLLAIATGVAIIVGAILGIQFMTAGIDKKVQVKESLFPYLISCLVVFGAFGIWKLVVIIMSNF